VHVTGSQRYRKLGAFLSDTFGEKVYKIGVYGGFTCPNRDGSKGSGGCLYCNPASSAPVNYVPGMSVTEQLAVGCRYLGRRHGSRRFIAYFQDYSTTYADVDRLEALYREALASPGIVGLALCTRPDCLSAEILDLLATLNRETFLWVELGLQSAHEATLAFLNRCHSVADSRRAITGLRRRDIAVSGHVILGLPGESRDAMRATAGVLTETGVHGAKLHNLHVVADTPLAEMHRRGEYQALTMTRYIELAIDFLEHLPPAVVIQRLCGDAPPRLTVAPDWAPRKMVVVNAIEQELVRRDTWQGKALGAALEDLRKRVALPGMSGRARG